MTDKRAVRMIKAASDREVAAERKRCAGIADRYGDSDWNADIHNEPPQVALGIETASRAIAAAIRKDEAITKQEAACYNCGSPLIGPICPECNPSMEELRREVVAGLEIIAGKRQGPDNLMGNADIARALLTYLGEVS